MKRITFFFFLLFSISLYSQTSEINKCGHDEWLEQIEIQIPGYNQEIQNSFKNFKQQNNSGQRLNITIPVHVIVVHPTGQPIGTGSNHSVAHVQSQIDVLNQDFGMYNSDSGNTPPVFPAGDTGIQFCLASVDPDGNPTDGITRYAYDGAFHPNSSAIREETRWPRDSYSNIWSAPNLPYLGLASVPSTSSLPSPNQDFIHVDAATFGGPGFATEPNYNLGRTTTHEMGHWLGLFHIWGTGAGGCGNDDGISDTPIQSGSNFGCPNHPSPSCGNGGDMFMNYMDYVNDNCMNAFTVNQGDYMNTILSTSRASLNGSSFTACAASVPLVITVSSQMDPSCSDSSDGFILVEAAGGNPDYSYSINGGVPTPNNLFTDLSGGNYTIEAFDSDGNMASTSVFLNTPIPLTATITTTQTNACPSQSDGAIEIQVAGGSNPFMYSLNMGAPQTSNVFDGLVNGFYAVNIVDNNGCMLEEIFELTGDADIMITIDSTANLICGNDYMGAIIAVGEGGSGPLSYSLNGFDFQETGEFLELDGGMYTVFVQDSVGCYDSIEVVLTEPDPFFLSFMSNDVTCFGGNDGSLDVTAMGGNGGPFQYSFDSITFGDATMLDSLFAGEYDLYALDSLGCPASATFDINEPDEIQIVTDNIINVVCFGGTSGSASFSAIGGSESYTFIFEGDSTATANYNNLSVGMYDINVVDSNGCVGSTTFTIDLNSTIGIDIANEEMPSCTGFSDGSIEVIATDTQGDVEYTINGVGPQSSPIFSGLSAGDYLISVQDSTGCEATINVVLGEPMALTINITVTDVKCNGDSDGSVDITVTGGTAPYQYNYQSDGFDPESIPAGTYMVTVSDENGCAIEEEFTVNEPVELLIDSSAIDFDLNTLTVFASGGTEPLMFSFDGGAFSESNVTDDLGGSIVTVIVMDANGCETEGSFGIDGVEDLAEDWGINAFPNPFLEELNIELTFPTQVNASIEVFDVQGKLIHNISVKNYNAGENFVKIDLSNFASSIYIVKIASAEGYRYIKATKM